MSEQRVDAFVETAARLGLAGVFLYTGALKALDPGSFAQDIANYRALPELLVGPVALLLPAAELVVGVGLLWPSYVAGSALLSSLMLLAFAAGMGQARLRGIDLDCGCFGAAGTSRVSWGKVALDLGLAMLSLWIVARRIARPAPAPEEST